MQLGPHFTPKQWAKILELFDIKPPLLPSSKESDFKTKMRDFRKDMRSFHRKDLAFRKEIINIIRASIYQHVEQTKNVKLIPLRGDIKIEHKEGD